MNGGSTAGDGGPLIEELMEDVPMAEAVGLSHWPPTRLWRMLMLPSVLGSRFPLIPCWPTRLSLGSLAWRRPEE